MLFGSKRERFEEDDSTQGVIPFEDYATREQKQDETPVKEIITYERKKPKRRLSPYYWGFLNSRHKF